jgi:glycosyltransferase 2 family protein
MGTAVEPKAGKKKRDPLQWVAYLISAICLWWVYHNFAWRDEIPRLKAVHWWWIVLACCCDFLVYIVQSWRWNALLKPVKRVPFWRTVQAIYIGLFANEVLPLKSGEIVRCYLLAHWNHLPFPKVFSSAMIERLIDGIILVAGFFWILRLGHLPKRVEAGVAVLVGLVILLGTLVIFAVLNKRFAHHVTTGHRWSESLLMIVEGLHLMARSPSSIEGSFASLVYLGLQVVPVYALMAGYQLGLGWTDALVVLLIVRLGTIVPGAPSNIGVFQLVAFLSLHTVLGVEQETAKSVAFLMFMVITVPLLAGGSVALALTGSDLHEVYEQARNYRHHPAKDHNPDRERR